jgi:hypothetical protein
MTKALVDLLLDLHDCVADVVADPAQYVGLAGPRYVERTYLYATLATARHYRQNPHVLRDAPAELLCFFKHDDRWRDACVNSVPPHADFRARYDAWVVALRRLVQYSHAWHRSQTDDWAR